MTVAAAPYDSADELPRDFRGLIAAVSPEGVIGRDGTIPWRYRSDQRRFRRLTLGTTVIMGRATWESFGGKPLAKRRNVVLSSRDLELPDGVDRFPSIEAALATCDGPVWFIGGERIYAEAMELADLIDVTYVPDHVPTEGAARFPEIDPRRFRAGPLVPHEDPALSHRSYIRRTE